MSETAGVDPASGGSTGRSGSPSVDAAAALARRLLGGDVPRLRHSAAVAARAESLLAAVDADDRGLLVTAAWLHDIGYAPTLRATGFHPLDGARYLRLMGWDRAVCNLVAHHSGSRYVAAVLSLSSELAEFDYHEGPVPDALTVADQTVGQRGEALTIEERMTDMLARHWPSSPSTQAHYAREPYIRDAAHRVATRLDAARPHVARSKHE